MPNWAVLPSALAAPAPDLLGHGASAKPMGDYSWSSHAATVRDLLDHLDISSATLIGHSFGGGIALQFAYLFPDRAERLVLVSSGGLGRQLSLLLRAAALPGAEWVLPFLASRSVREHCEAAGRALGRFGVRAGPDITEGWQGFVSLGDAESRRAFLATVRTVIDLGGQTVDAGPRLYLAARMPTLLIWGLEIG